jgi:hypothetical protein
MERKMIGSTTQSLESSTGTADTSADAIGANIVELPFRKIRAQIAGTKSTSETLRQGIGELRRALEIVEGLIGGIDDREAREEHQRRVEMMNQLLLLQLDRLSAIDDLLQVALGCTHGPK